MPSVSVVVPIYNYARYLQDAIESVLRQTYTDWELLVVDDGSTDGGDRIATDYAQRFPSKVFLTHHPGRANRGLGATLNRGIRQGSGKYVAILDADDVWLPHKLEKQVEVMERHPDVGLVYGRFCCVDEQTQRLTRPTPPYGLHGEWGDGPPGRPFRAYEMVMRLEITAPPSTWMLRKGVVVDVGLFPEGLKHLVQDQVLWAKVARRSAFYYVPELLTLYRLHPSSWSCSQNELSIIDADLEAMLRLAADTRRMDALLADGVARSLRRYWRLKERPLGVRLSRMEAILRSLWTYGALPGVVARWAGRRWSMLTRRVAH